MYVRCIVTVKSILIDRLLCHCIRRHMRRVVWTKYEFSQIKYVAQTLMHGAFVCALRGAFKSDFWTNFAIPAGLPTFGLFGFFLAMDSMPFGIYTYRYIYPYIFYTFKFTKLDKYCHFIEFT